VRITWENLALQVPKDAMLALLDDWRWLVDNSYSPFMVTSMGDMVLANASGRIFLLDTGGCELIEIAESLSDFQKAISIKDNAQAWFLTSVLGDLLEAGATNSRSMTTSSENAAGCEGVRSRPRCGLTRALKRSTRGHAIEFAAACRSGERRCN
jgi:hypothetical protein